MSEGPAGFESRSCEGCWVPDPNDAALRGCDDRNAVRVCGVGEAFVIAHESFEIVAEIEGRREMDRVERAKHCRIEPTGRFEHRRNDWYEGQSIEYFACSNGAVWREAVPSSRDWGKGIMSGIGRPRSVIVTDSPAAA